MFPPRSHKNRFYNSSRNYFEGSVTKMSFGTVFERDSVEEAIQLSSSGCMFLYNIGEHRTVEKTELVVCPGGDKGATNPSDRNGKYAVR